MIKAETKITERIELLRMMKMIHRLRLKNHLFSTDSDDNIFLSIKCSFFIVSGLLGNYNPCIKNNKGIVVLWSISVQRFRKTLSQHIHIPEIRTEFEKKKMWIKEKKIPISNHLRIFIRKNFFFFFSTLTFCINN